MTPRQDWLRALSQTARIEAAPSRLLADVVQEIAGDLGDAPALISDPETLSWRDLSTRANAYGLWALAQGLGVGDRVALMMSNRADYPAIWLGLSRMGVVTALINTHLRGQSLAHCLNAADPRHVIVESRFAAPLESALSGDRAWTVWIHGPSLGRFRPILPELAEMPVGPATPRRTVTIADPALLIYTSGTTGFPKAALVSHRRVMAWSAWFAGMLDIGRRDRLYDCLPMYHSIGGVAAVGAALWGGAAVVVRERFSASHFWDDVAAHECTMFQYIGELCRYLVNAPRTESEQRHGLRLACGNGLSAEVWRRFQDRFRIPRIVEFYAATEGNFSIYNCEGRPGSVGRVPRFLAHLSNIALVAIDPATQTVERRDDGRCARVAPGEVGEAIGEIRRGNGGQVGRFEGYTDTAASEAKLLRDVFVEGDLWVRSGDLMRQDADGFYYFVDRIGDTFRWKGENVATTEVQDALTGCPGVLAANVYGVTAPGAEGRAGMAALVVDDEFDIAALQTQLHGVLPAYAQPLFVRICPSLEVTATFKLSKIELARQGFDPDVVQDKVYFRDPENGAYVRLDRDLYGRLAEGAVRL